MCDKSGLVTGVLHNFPDSGWFWPGNSALKNELGSCGRKNVNSQLINNIKKRGAFAPQIKGTNNEKAHDSHKCNVPPGYSGPGVARDGFPLLGRWNGHPPFGPALWLELR